MYIIDPDILNNADLVVTLCGDAADKCPMTPPHVKREHWGFDDPAKAEGTEEEKWAFFLRSACRSAHQKNLKSIYSMHNIPQFVITVYIQYKQ